MILRVVSVFHVVDHKFCLQRVLLNGADYLTEISNPKWETWLRSIGVDFGLITSIKILPYSEKYSNVFDGRQYQIRLKELAGF